MRLVDFPYVVVRLECNLCHRKGAYRLARLAVRSARRSSSKICFTGSHRPAHIGRGNGSARAISTSRDATRSSST